MTQAKLLVVGIKLTKTETGDLDRILNLAVQQLKIPVEFSIVDLRHSKLPTPLPRYILAVGQQTANYIDASTEKEKPVVVTIPKPKEFLADNERKAAVWTVLKGLFTDLHKGVLDTIPLEGMDKRKLTLHADVIADKLTNKDLVTTFKKTIEEKGPLVIECKGGQTIHIYHDKIPGKHEHEFTADEFFLLMSALLLFDASAARLAKEE